MRVRAGQKVRIESPGGGGYGNPWSRPPEKVARDVRLGFVSRENARTLYGVEVDRDGQVDVQATDRLREGKAA